MSEKLNLNNLYNNIYCLAKNKKLKIGELEKKCGMNVGDLSRLKLTNVSIRLDKAYNICQQFGCSLDDMCNKNFEKEYKKMQIIELEKQIESLKKECNE